MRTLWSIGVLIAGLATGFAGSTTSAAGPAQSGSTGAGAAAKLSVQEYNAFEKKLGDGFQALQMHVTANAGAEAAKDAEQLAVVFGDLEQFWTQNKRADAAKWAQDSATYATQAAGSASAGDFRKAKQAVTNIERNCTQCHRTYRQANAAGGFQIKTGVVKP